MNKVRNLSDSDRPLRIATRQSPLALWQARYVAHLLSARDLATELVPLVSSGDTDMRPIDGSRQIGVFTKRIQQALLDDEADVAVHSLKDLPTEGDPRLALAAVPERESVADCLVSTASWNLEQLPHECRVGTGSRRRAAQLRHHRPDLKVEPIRGNVQTRLAKLEAKEYDAIMLAEAGIRRLEMDDLPRAPLTIREMLPAPGQGALAIEIRRDDSHAHASVAPLDHLDTRASVDAERRLLARLNGGCLAPIAAFGELSQDHEQLRLQAVVLSEDGATRLEEHGEIAFQPAHWQAASEQLADQVSERLLARGADELIAQQR